MARRRANDHIEVGKIVTSAAFFSGASWRMQKTLKHYVKKRTGFTKYFLRLRIIVKTKMVNGAVDNHQDDDARSVAFVASLTAVARPGTYGRPPGATTPNEWRQPSRISTGSTSAAASAGRIVFRALAIRASEKSCRARFRCRGCRRLIQIVDRLELCGTLDEKWTDRSRRPPDTSPCGSP